MKYLTVFSGLVLGFFVSTAALAESATGELLANCDKYHPEQPAIPNGLQASEEEMVAAQQSLKAYLAEGDKFIECLHQQEQNWGDSATEEQKAVVVLYHNKMVDDMQSLAELFNSAVRAYKGKK